MAKDAFYFRHDANSRNDERILELRAAHGMAGYGIFWSLIEMMRESENFSIMRSLCVGTAFALHIDRETLNKVIDICIRVGLFIENGDIISSKRLDREMSAMESKSKKASQSALKMHERRANAERTQSERMLKEDILINNILINNKLINNKKNIKEKKIEIIKKNYHDFVTLSDSEYSKLIANFGQTKTDWCIQIIGNYKGAKGAKYKSDYMAILGWPSEKYEEKRMKFETVGLSQKSIIALTAGNEFIQNQEEFGDVEGVEWAQ